MSLLQLQGSRVKRIVISIEPLVVTVLCSCSGYTKKQLVRVRVEKKSALLGKNSCLLTSVTQTVVGHLEALLAVTATPSSQPCLDVTVS